jgi:tetratricopeptide (TPR) repeat protein
MSPPGHPTHPIHSTHPTQSQLDGLYTNRLTTEEQRAVLRHLLTRCEVCRAYLRRRLDPGPDPAFLAPAPDEERGWRLTAAGPMDRLLATSLWAVLEGRNHVQQLRMVAHDPRFHEPTLVERLIEVGGERQLRDPHAARDLARLALAVADHLDPTAHPRALVADCRTAALAHLGDAERRCEDLAASQRAFALAWSSLHQGSGDARDRANLMRLEAALRFALGDRERGLRRLRSAASIYQSCKDFHEQGRTVLQMAQALGHRDPWRGVALARESLDLIDGRGEPRLELSARHGLAWFLDDAGESREALELLEGSRLLYRQMESSQPRLHQSWLEGRISRSLGDLGAAEETLKTVWRDFRESGFNQDLTLVSLDLAEVFVARRKTRHAVLLLRRFEPTLRLFKMHPHGMAAWLLVREALGTEAAHARSLLREAALYFRQAWRRPLPFRRRGRR